MPGYGAMENEAEVVQASSRRMRAGIQVALIAVLAAAFVLFGGLVAAAYVLPLDDVYANYDDRDDAAYAGAIDEGWVPIYLPDEMVDIHERHDWDRCIAVLRFTLPIPVMRDFSEDGAKSMGFEPVDAIDAKLLRRAESWLQAVSNTTVPGFADPGYRFYGGKRVQASGPTFLAVHAESGVVFHWIR
jgi:hypothetical protein